MIVCSCQGVTESEVRAACKSAGLSESCRAGKGCGGCMATISAIRAQMERSSSSQDEAGAADSSGANLQNRDAG